LLLYTIDKNSTLLKWSFDIAIIETLFDSFCKSDMWPILEQSIKIQQNHTNLQHAKIHFVRAGKNLQWTTPILEKFQELVTFQDSNINLHFMPHVGHWLHAEDLDGLLKIMLQNSKLY